MILAETWGQDTEGARPPGVGMGLWITVSTVRARDERKRLDENTWKVS